MAKTIITIPGNPGIEFQLRQPNGTIGTLHAQMLGVTFANTLIHQTNREFLISMFEELRNWNDRRVKREKILWPTTNDSSEQ